MNQRYQQSRHKPHGGSENEKTRHTEMKGTRVQKGLSPASRVGNLQRARDPRPPGRAAPRARAARGLYSGFRSICATAGGKTQSVTLSEISVKRWLTKLNLHGPRCA